jgi:membrane protein
VITRIQHLRRSVRDFLNTRIWDQDVSTLPWWRAFLIRQLRIAVIFAKGFGPGRIQLRASAMTYTSLLTMGPVLVIGLSVFSAFGGLSGLESKLEEFLIDNLSPGSQQQVRVWLYTFFEGVRSGAFRSLSVLVFLGAVLGLLGSLEQAFNDIWGVHRGRSLFQRLPTYTTLVVLGPILVGVSLSITAALETSALRVFFESRLPILQSVSHIVFKLVPILFTGLALTMLYTIMPNVRVRLRASLPAGLVAGVIWEVTKILYTGYMRRASHYGTLYGSLAAVPLFLIWVWVSWLVVLFGAQLAFARDAAQDWRREEEAVHASTRERLRVALHLALATARSYFAGSHPPELVALSRQLRQPLRLVRAAAEELVDGGILHQLASTRQETSLVPARSPELITVYDVLSCVIDRGIAPGTAEAPSIVEDFLSDLDDGWRERWGNVSLKDLLEEQDQRAGQGVLPFPVKDLHFRPRRDDG